jgi:protein-S-isoprenylcysteine O-methyltransferase Ste14
LYIGPQKQFEAAAKPSRWTWLTDLRNTDNRLDLIERVFFGLLFANFLRTMLPSISIEPSTILLLASESLTGIMIIIRRRGPMATRPYPYLLAIVGCIAPWLIIPVGTPIAPFWLATMLMTLGLGVTVAAKICLARSFGVVPANRGVKDNGPYRLVRHPMYLGYILNQCGYLMACFSLFNLSVYLVAWLMVVLRILEEEKILGLDEKYQNYVGRVRCRLIPGLF